jgi:hypothetical protein
MQVMDPLVKQLPKVAAASPSGGKAASNSAKKAGSRDSSPADKGSGGSSSSSKSKKGGLREELGDGSITSKTKGGKTGKDTADMQEQWEKEIELWKQLGHLAEVSAQAHTQGSALL